MKFNSSFPESEITLDDILKETAMECIEKWQNEGMNKDELIEKLRQNVPSAYQKITDQVSDDYLNYVKSHFYEISAQYRLDDNVFLSHQDQKWGRCFAASEAMYRLVIEIAEDYVMFVANKVLENERAEHQNVYAALLHIHGRTCQIYAEILCLIKNGFADAATARWRTMYELCYIADFIKTAGEETARAYLEQSDTAKQKPMWAKKAPCFSNKGLKFRPNLKEIEKTCDFTSKWEKQYKISCLVTHGSPQGTLGRVANAKSGGGIIPVGKSDYGIVEPAVDSASLLAIITVLFITIYPNIEGIARCNMLSGWADVITEMYLTDEKEIFKELFDEEGE